MPRPTPAPEDPREAIRDLTGILRAMWRAEEPGSTKRPIIVEAGQRLAELAALLDEPDTEAYRRATWAADAAVNAVMGDYTSTPRWRQCSGMRLDGPF
jgi:hypothetical protein